MLATMGEITQPHVLGLKNESGDWSVLLTTKRFLVELLFTPI